MGAVLKNIDLRGSTMGSREEFGKMVTFVQEQRIHPVISRVVKGLDNLQGIDELFTDMKNGAQFGKLVIQLDESENEPELVSGQACVKL
jgi:D-arabinose 1-dehydrogenase-like Zn-dependent alcohol dehydrogenase